MADSTEKRIAEEIGRVLRPALYRKVYSSPDVNGLLAKSAKAVLELVKSAQEENEEMLLARAFHAEEKQAAAEADRDRLREALGKARDAIGHWIEWGLLDLHVGDCPGDDTCDCPEAARANEAHRVARTAFQGASPKGQDDEG